MADRIQIRRDTASNWSSVNPILAQGETGIETDSLGTSTVLQKIGDGSTDWNSLPYQESGSGVESVSGDGVDDSDPLNPIISFPNADEVEDSSTTNKFLTQAEKDKITQNESFIDLLQTNKADQSDLDNLSGRVTQNESDITNLQGDKADNADLLTLQDSVNDNTQNISDLQINKADQSDLDNLGNDVSNNAQSILDLDGRVAQNETDILDKISISTVASATEKGGLFFDWDSANDIMTIDNQPL